jgi:hypothetical protein
MLLEQVDYVLTPGGYEMHSGAPETLRGQHTPDEVDYEALVGRFKEANDTYQVTVDRTGRMHETVLLNADQLSKGLVLRPSTSFSSGLKNPANLLETALAATLNPGAAYLYWGSFGNSPTGHMSPQDRAHVRKTGRYTKGNGSEESPYVALDAVKDLVDMLAEQERLPTHFVADQEAGRLVLPIMVELETDSVRGAFLNGINGISPSASYVRASLTEDLQSRVRRRNMGPGKPGELTPVNIKDLKQHMPQVYSGWHRFAHLAPLPVFLFPLDDRDKVGVTIGFHGHKNLDDLDDHAVYQDMSAALRNQDTTVAMQFNQESAQHDVEDCYRYGALVMDNIPGAMRRPTRGIRLLIGHGTHTQNTDSPYEAVRTQRLGLPDITHRMAVLAGTGVLDSKVFELPALGESA